MAVRGSEIHKGHRARMRSKLIRNTDRAFDTYELLEMLLYHVVPYKDTNPVSKNLLNAFGSLDGVFSATREELLAVEGVGERVAELILSVSDFASLMYSGDVGEPAVRLDNYKTAGIYAVEYLSKFSGECVAMMLLDNRMSLIDARIIYNKKYESAGVRADAFLNYAISGRASVVMTAELKPHGPLCPTVGDMETTKMVSESLSSVGILHIEHFVTSGKNFMGTVGREKFKVGQSAEIDRFLKSREEYCSNG